MSKVYVKTDGPLPEFSARYITPGKVYEVVGTIYGGLVTFDDGNQGWINIPESTHLDDEPWTLCDQHGKPVAEQKECKCSLRIKLVGDGCEVCNPSLAQEHAFMAASDRAAEAVAERDRYKALAEQLADDLAYMASQHRCGCAHPACNRCADDAMCEAALAKYDCSLKEQQEKGV
jgi:hypothetical protein